MKQQHPEIASSTKPNYNEIEDEAQSYSSSEEDEEEEGEEAEIVRELADVPFGELQKLRSDGTIAFNLIVRLEKKMGRANKNRPMEVSSKRPVSRFREVIQVPKKTIRDPRFESLCGKLDEEGFKKRYNFLFSENIPAEKEELQKLMKSSKDPKVVEETKGRIAWIEKQLKADAAKHAEERILAEHKKREREAAKQGKRPFYLKKLEIRKQRLIEKYERLKAVGKLDSYIDKRRKRNAAKDRRFMPYQRQSNGQQQE